MRILLYAIIITAGILLSSKGKLNETVEKNLSKLQYASLLLLLFVMGLNIGINENIIKEFGKLGLQAIVLSLSSIIFSVAAVKLITAYFMRKERVVRQDEL